MLNELTLIRNGIAAIDRSLLQPIHKHLAEPGKKNLLRVVLAPDTADGSIAELDYLGGEKHKNYWTQGEGNKNQFPAVKLPFPLRSGGVGQLGSWKQQNKNPPPDKLLDYLRTLREKHPFDPEQKPWPSYREKLKQRAKIYQPLNDPASIVASLLDTFLAIDGLALLKALDEKLWAECRRTVDKDMLKMAALILFADGGELKPDDGSMKDGKRPTLLLDLKVEENHCAAHKHWKQDISKMLYEQELLNEQEQNAGNIGTCAVSGHANMRLISDTFPDSKCNHLGNVKIFSRKKGVPTYKRYGKLAADSMAISADLADEMASALRYLNNKVKGKTWDVLPGETGSGDLLLTFCRALPDIEPVKLLTYDDSTDDFDEDDYERECEQICESFTGRDIDLEIEPRIDFLVLRKINDGVQKAIFSSSQRLEKLSRDSKNWNQAGKNTPPIRLAFFKKGDETSRFLLPSPISPKPFAMLFKKHYAGNIERKQTNVPGLPFAEAMMLFLNEQCDTDLVNRLLNKLLIQFSNLLEQAALGKTKPAKHHRDARNAISAMGILLYKLNRRKEVYMNELAYKLGQFCSVLDEIHTGYCASERNGQMPGRLVGNQTYAAAIINPIKALGITAQRFAVYQAWAKRNSQQTDEQIKNRKIKKELEKEIKKAKYAYFWLRDNCADLQSLIREELPAATAASRAELLLGYLAGRPFDKKAPSNKSAPTESE